MKEILIIIRNFLYRLFLIGLVFSVLSQLALVSINVQGLTEASKILHVSSNYLMELMLKAITDVKNFLFFGVLCPAIALHWTISKDKLVK